jgi:hypothetical protein
MPELATAPAQRKSAGCIAIAVGKIAARFRKERRAKALRRLAADR